MAAPPGLSLGQSLWRSMPHVIKHLGLAAELRRRPWVLEPAAREALEAKLGLSTDGLMTSLLAWLQTTTRVPVAAGFAGLSGRIYLGPALDLVDGRRLTPTQALVANLCLHGGPGINSMSASAPPCRASVDLLRELAVFREVQWLDPRDPSDMAASPSQDGFGFGLRGTQTSLVDVVGEGGG